MADGNGAHCIGGIYKVEKDFYSKVKSNNEVSYDISMYFKRPKVGGGAAMVGQPHCNLKKIHCRHFKW